MVVLGGVDMAVGGGEGGEGRAILYLSMLLYATMRASREVQSGVHLANTSRYYHDKGQSRQAWFACAGRACDCVCRVMRSRDFSSRVHDARGFLGSRSEPDYRQLNRVTSVSRLRKAWRFSLSVVLDNVREFC